MAASADSPRSMNDGAEPVGSYRNYALLAAAVFLLGGAFGVQQPLFANFIFERFEVRTHEYGYLESLRETPGFLTVFLSALLMLTAAPRIGSGALVVMGVGIAAYAWVVQIAGALGGAPILALIVTSVFWSIGFHTWSPIEPTLALRFSPTHEKGRWLGWLRTISGLGHLALMGLTLLVIRWIEYEGMFLVAGGLLVLAGVLIGFARQATGQETPRADQRRILLRRRYSVYYFLTFLAGARRQIFIMFAVWLLVNDHEVPRNTIVLLMIVNQVINLFVAPTFGRLVDRLGERPTLAVSYALLTAVFVGYAFVQDITLICLLYVVDNILFIGGIALTTYLHKIAPPDDLRPTLTMGVTMNHVPAVFVPLVGGLLWSRMGPAIVFLIGAGFAFVSLVATYWIRPETQAWDVVATETRD